MPQDLAVDYLTPEEFGMKKLQDRVYETPGGRKVVFPPGPPIISRVRGIGQVLLPTTHKGYGA
jgi:hypothetical protein